jgi:hypothetical protein
MSVALRLKRPTRAIVHDPGGALVALNVFPTALFERECEGTTFNFMLKYCIRGANPVAAVPSGMSVLFGTSLLQYDL